MYKVLFVALSLMLLSSCGDSDELSGTWNLVSANTTGCEDTNQNITITAGGDCNLFCLEEQIIIEDDGTFTTVTTIGTLGDEIVETTVGTYTVDGDQITTCFDGTCKSGTYEVIGDVLRLSREDFDGECDVASSYNRG